MFCQHCGNQVQDSAAFCPACGQPVDGGGAPSAGRTTEQPRERAQAPSVSPAQPQVTKNATLPYTSILRVLGIIMTALWAVVVVGAAISGGSGEAIQDTNVILFAISGLAEVAAGVLAILTYKNPPLAMGALVCSAAGAVLCAIDLLVSGDLTVILDTALLAVMAWCSWKVYQENQPSTI